MDTLSVLCEIFRNIFDDESLTINRETSADDIEGWDSLAHISIIAACEEEFNIKLDVKEIISFRNIGDMLDIIERRLK